MGIIRVEKNGNYVVMNKTALQDEQLSWKAKGILSYMLSLPDDWTFYIEELTKHATDGETSFRSGLDELKKRGYVKRYPIKGENNKIVKWETVVSELPEKPLNGNPHVDTPDMEDQGLLSIDSKLSNDTPIKGLYDFWNQQRIIQHRKLTQKMKSHVNARLGDYTEEELKKAISNYKEVITGEKYYWTHKWTFEEFMKPSNVVRFLDEAQPFSNFAVKKSKPKYQQQTSHQEKPKEVDIDDELGEAFT